MDESATVPEGVEPAPSDTEDGRIEGRMNRPRRGLVALVELVLALAAAWAATWAWAQVATTITMRASGGTEVTSRLYSGPWVAAAIGFGLVAALLVVDIVRELTLALRTRK